jgi:hypothetical protein
MVLMDVLAKNAKKGDSWQSRTLEEPYFLVLLLFASYGIWCVVIHGILAPKSKVGGGTMFHGFFLGV